MGYTTEFQGQFNLDRPLSKAHRDYLEAFSSSRRMERDPKIALDFPDPLREAVNLPIGDDAGYFVSGPGLSGQDRDPSVVNYNGPPSGQPGLWCQWVPNKDGTAIEWDGGEKFYYYTQWLSYIIKHFLQPWGYTLNGIVKWRGEEFDDLGNLEVKNNVVSSHRR